MKKEHNSYKEIAKKEWQYEKKDKKLQYLLTSIFSLSILALITILTIHIFQITGNASIDAQGGYITRVNLHSKTYVEKWGGFYGLVLRVPTFTQILSENLESGTIQRTDVFFDCIDVDASGGGPEIYASLSDSLDLRNGIASPATVEWVDQVIGCTDLAFCANNTYIRNMSVYIGSTLISNVPSTHTYKYNGENQIFDIGILNVSGNLVFVSHVNGTIQKGYNPDYLVNFQMLLPTPENTTQTYYFYTDPFDQCPEGGIGNSLNATVWGYVKDISGNPLANATVSFIGSTQLTNSIGFYNITAEALTGTYKGIAQKTGYLSQVQNITINNSFYKMEVNYTLEIIPESETIPLTIYGTVKDIAGNSISDALVIFGNNSGLSNTSGLYSFQTLVNLGNNPIVSIKTNYDNYYALININGSSLLIQHNIIMDLANLNTYPTGPYTEDNADPDIGDQTQQQIQQIIEQTGEDFWVSTREINKQVRENTFVGDEIGIYNFKTSPMRVTFTVSPELEKIIQFQQNAITIQPNSFETAKFTIFGTEEIGIYRGKVAISGDITQDIPTKIEIIPKNLPVETLLLEIELFDKIINPGNNLKYKLNLQNLLTEQQYQVQLKHLLLNTNGTIIYLEDQDEIEIDNSLSILKQMKIPENFTEGSYLLSVEARYLDLFSTVSVPITISKQFYLYSFFGIPIWLLILLISALSFTLLVSFMYNQHSQKKKRYHTELDISTLPKPGERAIKIGRLAEKSNWAYYNLDDLTTHAIVAGATGGGKSISAQVFVEEALLKGIAVIVFDPTAQWSGMLRKCEDKKMMSFYPKFDLKPQDAKAFAGNVKEVKNERQSIDVNKYMNPGQIQIFTLNKLTPQQIDIFVAGVISNIFKSDPKEHPGLKTLLVFDEVHRLLPKFGGSGKGFLQIERACREFRKWGLGVMLVSQVLSDFVGEIKANINTEVQMRVAEENDLERIKERYGLEALKSLVRTDIGTGMIQNAEYNKGRPYFVNLRPILHSTRRLSDEVLEKYNQYNEKIEDLQYQIEQLETEKIDTFDLKMELKLVKDKLMSGNFTVVDIYLESLIPRLEKEWGKINKKPKKKEIELINVDELESALDKAKKDREKWAAINKKEEKTQEKQIPNSEKIVAPLTFDNGIMISSLKELKDTLPNVDNTVFRIHVNDEKNDIASWIETQIDSELGKKIKEQKQKTEIIASLEEFIKKEKPEKKDDESEKT